MDMESLNILRRVGLNQYESKIYLALLKHGPSSASELGDLAAIPRPRTYDVLDKLEKRGFVAMQPGRPVMFRAVDVQDAFKVLKKKREDDLRKQLEELDGLQKKLVGRVRSVKVEKEAAPESHVWVLKNRDNISSQINSLIENAGKQIIISATSESLAHKLDTYEDTLIKAKQRGVDIRVFSPTEDKELMRRVSRFGSLTKHKEPHRMIVVDDHVVMFLTPEGDSKTETGAWLKSPYLAESMRRLLFC